MYETFHLRSMAHLLKKKRSNHLLLCTNIFWDVFSTSDSTNWQEENNRNTPLSVDTLFVRLVSLLNWNIGFKNRANTSVINWSFFFSKSLPFAQFALWFLQYQNPIELNWGLNFHQTLLTITVLFTWQKICNIRINQDTLTLLEWNITRMWSHLIWKNICKRVTEWHYRHVLVMWHCYR